MNGLGRKLARSQTRFTSFVSVMHRAPYFHGLNNVSTALIVSPKPWEEGSHSSMSISGGQGAIWHRV